MNHSRAVRNISSLGLETTASIVLLILPEYSSYCCLESDDSAGKINKIPGNNVDAVISHEKRAKYIPV